jgi:hypothetical protein
MGASENRHIRYVQIPEHELSQLSIEHLTSAIDMSIGLPDHLASVSGEVISGYTEWIGSWRGRDVTIGWDWGFYQGEILMLSAAEIRTNIQLLASADFSPSPPLLARGCLARWLDTIPWREGTIRDLIQRNCQQTQR